MSFTWSEFHDLARALADVNAIMRGVSDGARQRAAISRSYYAAFCSARNYLRIKEGKSYSGSNAHSEVRTGFLLFAQRTGNAPAKEIANLLRQAQLARKDADYEDTYRADVNIQNALEWTEAVLRRLERLP